MESATCFSPRCLPAERQQLPRAVSHGRLPAREKSPGSENYQKRRWAELPPRVLPQLVPCRQDTEEQPAGHEALSKGSCMEGQRWVPLALSQGKDH